MASLLVLSMTSFDDAFLGGMVLPDDERLMCLGSIVLVAKYALMVMKS